MKRSKVQNISGLDMSSIIEQADDKWQIEVLLFKNQDSPLIQGAEISVQAYSKNKRLIKIEPSFKKDEMLVECHMAGGASAHAIYFYKFDPKLEVDRLEVDFRGEHGTFYFC